MSGKKHQLCDHYTKLPFDGVSFSYSIEQDRCNVEFTVQKDLITKPSKNMNEKAYKNWGLWEFDVFEFFFRPVGQDAYFEVQVSPGGHGFQLSIIQPREVSFTPMDLNYHYSVSQSDDEYSCSMSIKGLASNAIEGNFFAILQNSGHPKYLMYNPSGKEIADFHDPNLFVSLDNF